MSNLSAPIGAIVRVWFPQSEDVMTPGPKLRPCVVVAEEVRNGRHMVLLAYGTSQNTNHRDLGEFTIKAGSYSFISKDTRFQFLRSIWLPMDAEYFHGRPEMLKDVDLRASGKALIEAKLF